MNKSTPISQLPNNNNMQNQSYQNFMTEQQRQNITNAQNAISTSQIPQNTQISADITNDDDVVVKDILSQLNQLDAASDNPSNINEQQIKQQLLMQQQYQQQQYQQQQYQQQQQQAMRMAAEQAQIVNQSPYDNILQNTPSSPFEFKDYLTLFTDDLKLASLVFITVIIVHFIPLDKIIGRYFAIDKIPYHEVLLRATMAAIIIIIIKKLAKI